MIEERKKMLRYCLLELLQEYRREISRKTTLVIWEGLEPRIVMEYGIRILVKYVYGVFLRTPHPVIAVVSGVILPFHAKHHNFVFKY